MTRCIVTVGMMILVAYGGVLAAPVQAEKKNDKREQRARSNRSKKYTGTRQRQIVHTQSSSSRELVDKIAITIYGEKETEIILQSEIDRPGIDGQRRTTEDIVFDRLILQDAQKFGVIPDEQAVDKHLASIQRENNLSLKDLTTIFESAGYRYEEGREQFKIMSTVNSMLSSKIHTRLLVPERDVIAYYDAHPETVPAAVLVKRGTAFYGPDKQKQKERLEKYRTTNAGIEGITWSSPFWLQYDQVADDKRFLFSMKEGEISAPVALYDSYELFKIEQKQEEHLRPLQERYRDIAELLKRPRYERLMQEYKFELFSQASISYL